MKRVKIEPDLWAYTERMNDIGSDETIAHIRRSRTGRETPLVVMTFDQLPGKFAIVSGNHRALLAEWERRPLEAVVIESEQDFEAIEREQPTSWGEHVDESRKSRYEVARSEICNAALIGRRRKADL